MPRMKNTWVVGVMPARWMVTPGTWPARSRVVTMFCDAIRLWPITETATGVF